MGVAVVHVLLAVPFTGVRFGGVDEWVLPAGTESRVVSERLHSEFGGNAIDPIQVLVSGTAPETRPGLEPTCLRAGWPTRREPHTPRAPAARPIAATAEVSTTRKL